VGKGQQAVYYRGGGYYEAGGAVIILSGKKRLRLRVYGFTGLRVHKG
jgi:hypothetical protein